MNRLTRKDHKPHISSYECISTKEMANKLGKLEDIEENIGIELLTLFKTFEKGIYYIDEDYGIVKNEHELAIFCDCLWENNTNRYYFYKAYGKTWALTKKELMKSKLYKMYKEGKKIYE